MGYSGQQSEEVRQKEELDHNCRARIGNLKAHAGEFTSHLRTDQLRLN